MEMRLSQAVRVCINACSANKSVVTIKSVSWRSNNFVT